jgi:hypothetical protein
VSKTIDSLVIGDSSTATILGTGRVNNGPAQPFRVDVTRTATGSTFTIMWAGYAASGKVVLGQVKIKATSCTGDDNGGGENDDQGDNGHGDNGHGNGGGSDNGGGKDRGGEKRRG